MQHTSRQFDNELEGLRASVLAMGQLAAAQLQRIHSSLTGNGFAIADEVFSTEREINQAHSEIDGLCAKIVAKRQPAAADLRAILSTIHMISDIERIGDETKKVLQKIAEPSVSELLASIPEFSAMTALTKDMMARALAALDRQDVLSALDVLRLDTKVDADYHASIERLTRLLASQPDRAGAIMECAFIARSLERCGDHVKNVAESVVSMVRGDDVRHQH
jgi:phosphate transport system protein